MKTNRFLFTKSIGILMVLFGVFAVHTVMAEDAGDMAGQSTMMESTSGQEMMKEGMPGQEMMDKAMSQKETMMKSTSGEQMMAEGMESKEMMPAKAMVVQGDVPVFIGPVALQRIQEELRIKGFDPGSADGVWGSNTAASLKRFQETRNIAATGNLNIETIQSLGFPEILNGTFIEKETAAGSREQMRAEGGAQLFLSPGSLKQIQLSLQTEGFDVGKADGIWGKQTQYAVERFQNSRGLETTGHITMKMLDLLGMKQVVADLGIGVGQAQGIAAAAAQDQAAKMETAEYVERLKAAGMDVKTEAPSAASAPPAAINPSAELRTAEQNQMLRAQGMGVRTDEEVSMGMTLPSSERGLRGYYPESAGPMAGTGAALFAGPEIIKQVQQALNEKGYNPGSIDGKWGDATSKALYQYQASQNMAATGALTLSSINLLVGKDFSFKNP